LDFFGIFSENGYKEPLIGKSRDELLVGDIFDTLWETNEGNFSLLHLYNDIEENNRNYG